MAVTIGNWRFYTDATPDGSMVALAAQNTVPTLSGALTMAGKYRLRVQLVGDASGGTISVALSHSGDQSTLKGVDSQSTYDRAWIKWWNGAATASATVGTLLLSGSTVAGKYHEASAVSETVAASAVVEIDLALQNYYWLPPDTNVYLHLLNSSTALTYQGGVPAIAVTGCAKADRSITIDVAGTSSSGGQIRDMDFGSWPRTFYTDSGYYWFFAPRGGIDGTSTMVYWRWDGTGGRAGSWTKSTVALTGTITTTSDGDVRQIVCARDLGGAGIFGVLSRPSTATRYMRGRELAGTVTWGTNADISQTVASGDRTHCVIDSGGYHWIVGTGGTTSVWAVRSTAADDGSTGYVPSFGSRMSLSVTVPTANPVTALSTGSNSVAVFYRTASDLMMARVTGSGWGTATSVTDTTPVHFYDWGVATSGDWIYLNYREGTDDAETTWRFRCYQISTSTWTTTTAGAPPKASQISNNDGMPVMCDGDDVYLIGTAVGPRGGQDRPAQYLRYVGPGPNGSWDTSITSAASAGMLAAGGGSAPNGVGKLLEPGRGNGDDIAAGAVGGGKAVVAYLYGDTDINGHPFTYEYDYITLAAGPPSAVEIERWDGSALVAAEVERWDGAALVSQQFEL